jgi:hypothetical protein
MSELVQQDSNNIKVEIDCMSIIIHWKMGKWKTLQAILMGIHDFPKRIYSNTPIYKNGELINKPLNIDSLEVSVFRTLPE